MPRLTAALIYILTTVAECGKSFESLLELQAPISKAHNDLFATGGIKALRYEH